MNNFYFYQSKLNETKSNLIICFYSGRDLCVETFYNEVLAQFKIQFFSEDIIFITHQFNKDDVSEKLLNNIYVILNDVAFDYLQEHRVRFK